MPSSSFSLAIASICTVNEEYQSITTTFSFCGGTDRKIDVGSIMNFLYQSNNTFWHVTSGGFVPARRFQRMELEHKVKTITSKVKTRILHIYFFKFRLIMYSESTTIDIQ